MFVRSISATRNHFSSVFQGQAWPLPMRSCLLLGAKSEHTWSRLYTDLQGTQVLKSKKYTHYSLFLPIFLIGYFLLDIFSLDISQTIFLDQYFSSDTRQTGASVASKNWGGAFYSDKIWGGNCPPLPPPLYWGPCQILIVQYFLSIIFKMAVTAVAIESEYLKSCSCFLHRSNWLCWEDFFGDLTNMEIVFEILPILPARLYPPNFTILSLKPAVGCTNRCKFTFFTIFSQWAN